MHNISAKPHNYMHLIYGQKILSSTIHVNKGKDYQQFLECWLGTGLLTANRKWTDIHVCVGKFAKIFLVPFFFIITL